MRSCLKLARASWEDDKFGLVGLQPLHIGLQPLEGTVFTAVVHCNADCRGKLLRNACCLRLNYIKFIKFTKTLGVGTKFLENTVKCQLKW